ncbi:zinc finger Y-chromosomal protein 1-like isoform X3 [Rhopalosiphum padi]|uniref:zinc finger Y-chromosomal protein 1-like isoform X3 n=1 Tax=Rhopalosiphum padi TaxID=40932 RepID=UPI00298D66DF|nr:zinc finger Y-chromosomal protein 1-like isoform X3 [Rhopalosiphum padi]
MDKSNFSLPLIILNNKQILLNCTVVPENSNQNNDSNIINTINIDPNVKLHSNYTPEKNTTFSKKNQKKKGKIRFKCLHCEYLTFRKQNLIVHLKEKHEIKKQQETKVNNGTSNTTRTTEVFLCTLCKMTYNTLDKCKEHMAQVCKKYTTTTYHNLVNHVSMKHNKTLSCVDCGAEFDDSIKLQNHRVFHSKAKSVNKERWYMEKTCVICNMVLANSKSLKLHTKNVHLKLKPYVCQVCNHGSATKYMMQVHMRQHTGEKPFKCDAQDCNFKTGDHNSLRRHKLRHSEERPYKCTHCDYKCIQVTALKSHITNNHRDKMDNSYYSCNRCTFGTVSLKRYNDHIFSHETQVQNGLEPSPVKCQETKAEMTDDDDTAQGYVDDTGGITISESVGCAVLNLDDNAIMLT